MRVMRLDQTRLKWIIESTRVNYLKKENQISLLFNIGSPLYN